MDRVLILGATSAVACEVARLHEGRGDRLHLVGRSHDKLAKLAKDLGASSRVTCAQADFLEEGSNERVVREAIEALGGLDRVLVAHGELGDQLESERSFEEASRILRVNFTSVVSLLIPIASYLERERRGRIGVITSVAGDRGRPRNYTYGAAKGGLAIYLQGVRSRLYSAGVSVTTLKLGPVDTPMTVSHEKNALFARVEPVARGIVTAMDAGTPEAYVPSFWAAIMPIVTHTPERLFQKLPFLSGR